MDEKFLLIVKNALQVYTKFGIKSVSMDDLCREIGISKATLYKYVTNKEELLERIFVDYLAMEFAAWAQGYGLAEKKNAIDYFFSIIEYLQTHTVVNPLMLNDLQLHYPSVFEKIYEKERQQKYTILEKNLQQGQAENLYRSDINAPLVLFIFANTVIKDFQGISSFEGKDVFNEILRIYMCAIATPQGLEYYTQKMAQ
ncbi:MAG: TetR/AcrR family transcriptional regulator [Bacteroidales bacterium]|nr:TetR/AcrR family transcriptional regulator [Bacteroidales bacterium]